MKSKIILLFVFFTLTAYTQTSQVTTIPIENSATCSNGGDFAGMARETVVSLSGDTSFIYRLSPGTFNVRLGFHSHMNTVYRGYQEFDLSAIPRDVTIDNITNAILRGQIIPGGASPATVNIYRHDGEPLPCSNANNIAGWNYLAGDIQSGGIRERAGAFNFSSNHRIEELSFLDQVRRQRQNGRLILGYRNPN